MVVTEDRYNVGFAITRLMGAKIGAVGFNFKDGVNYYTIGHELSHILQVLKRMEKGEATCDLIAFSRSPKFVTYDPAYIFFGLGSGQITAVSKQRIHEIGKKSLKVPGLKKFSAFREEIRGSIGKHQKGGGKVKNELPFHPY